MTIYEFIVSVIGLSAIGFLGGVMAYSRAKSRRERSFLFKAMTLQAVPAFGILLADYLFQWSQPLLVLVAAFAIFIPIVFWVGRRLTQIRLQQDDNNA